MKTKLKGFTLVELVITIAIVIILSIISVPIYRGYVNKAKFAEGYSLLGLILSAQKSYYSEYGNFLRNAEGVGRTSCDTILGIDASGNKYFTFFFVGTGDASANLEKRYFNAAVIKPQELIFDDKSLLYLQYNITKGAKIFESQDAVVDPAWKS